MGTGRFAIAVLGICVFCGCSKKEEEGGWASVMGKKLGQQMAKQMKVEAAGDEGPGPALDCRGVDWAPLRVVTGEPFEVAPDTAGRADTCVLASPAYKVTIRRRVPDAAPAQDDAPPSNPIEVMAKRIQETAPTRRISYLSGLGSTARIRYPHRGRVVVSVRAQEGVTLVDGKSGRALPGMSEEGNKQIVDAIQKILWPVLAP